MNVSNQASGPDVRAIAAELLTRVDTRKAYAEILLRHALDEFALDDRDRALLTEIMYGTLRWRARLDRELSALMRRPIAKTDPFLRNLLRLSLYQLRFLDKVPDYAVIHEAVRLAKRQGLFKSSGFVNAVLRRATREKKQGFAPDLKFARTSDLAAHWSHPEWLVEKWLHEFGAEEAVALLEANNEAAPLVIRANRLKGSRDRLKAILISHGIDATATPWSPDGLKVRSRSPVSLLPGFADGCFQVQSEASQLVAFLLDPQPGERVLDACAAPGGKTTHIAELMEDSGHVAAADISAAGCKRIAASAARLGLRSITVLTADFEKEAPRYANGLYNRILVDAPCSGLGTLRAHPEIKWQRVAKDIDRLVRLQKRLLAHAARAVKPGGVLVYSTCTLATEENENVVADFLSCHENFLLEDASLYLPDQAKALVSGRYFLALPHRHNTDGFFAARMRKVK